MKNKLIYLFTVLCSTGVFTACSNDNGNGDPEPEVPVLLKGENTYDGDKLALTYSDAVMPGKQIKFGTTDGKTGTLTMSGVLDLSSLLSSKSDNTPSAPGVIPGETSTIISNIELKQSGNKYTFSGTDTNENRSVEYTGEVDSTKLTVSLKVKMATNNLLGTWNLVPYNYYTAPIYVQWDSEKSFGIDFEGNGDVQEMAPGNLVTLAMMMPFVNNKNPHQLLLSVLKNVTFKEDGNIVASYSKGENIQAPQWEDSPANIAQYYVKDNMIYLLLNPSMIISSIMTKAETSSAEEQVLQGLITNILPMLGTGFPLTYKIEGDNLTVFANTDLTMKLLSIVSPLLKDESFMNELLNKMAQDPQFASFMPMAKAIFGQLPEVLEKTTKFEVGIDLAKN